MPALSVIVVTFNEEKNIERCLHSVRWADEIVVVDSFSADRTVEIVRRYTDKIFQFEYPGYSKQVERGIQLTTSDWIFILDADEEVSDELARGIRETIENPGANDGYLVNRKVNVFGRWVEHGGWFPDWQFRLARKNSCIAEHQEIHGGFTTSGSKGSLEGLLYHYTYPSIESYLDKLNEYTSLHVSNKLKEDPKIHAGWYKILLSPLSDFVRSYIIKKGYKDGIVGFLLSVLSALYTLSLYSKVWEYRMREGEGNGFLPPVTNMALQQYKRS